MRKSEKIVYKMIKRHSQRRYKLATLHSLMLRIVFAMDIPASIKIGKEVQFVHNGLGCVFHPKAVIGDRCKIYQNVTIGGNGKIVDGKVTKGAPTLEEGVAVFSGACVLGPIRVGKGSIIGANAVVTKDVPPKSLVFGNPAVVKDLKFEYNFD